MLFEDRHQAGKLLAESLQSYELMQPVVLALPRGGVPVAYEIALRLDAPLDVLVARKLGAPENPEFGFGAIAPDNVRVIDQDAAYILGLTEDLIKQVERTERIELERRQRAYRGTTDLPDLTDRTVILVDDGLATGVTMRAAVMVALNHAPCSIIVAVPVCSQDAIRALRQLLRPNRDQILCLAAPGDFVSVGEWYYDFAQLTDAEVHDLLQRSRKPTLMEGRN